MPRAKESIYQVYRPSPGEAPVLHVVHRSRRPPSDVEVAGLVQRYLAWEDWVKGFFVPQLSIQSEMGHFLARNIPGAQHWLAAYRDSRIQLVEESVLALEWLYLRGGPTRTRAYLHFSLASRAPLNPIILCCDPAQTAEELTDGWLRDFRKNRQLGKG